MRLLLPLFLLLASVRLILAAGATFSFNVDGFMNSTGVIDNTMPWGIVVDTAGDGFEGLAYCEFHTNDGSDFYLETGAGLSDDYFYQDGGQTTLNNAGPPFFGQGGLISSLFVEYDINNQPQTDVTPLDQGMEFALFWTDGVSYGLFTDDSFVVPGATISEDFSGVTVAGAADIAFKSGDIGSTGNNGGGTEPEPPILPEPSAALMVSVLGFFSILRRKR